MKLTITKQEYKRFYIYNYFFAPKRLLRFMRRYLGPTLIIVGMYLHSSNYNFGIGYIAFCLAYGLFYTLKPFLLLMTMNPKDENFSFDFKERDLLFIKDRVREAEIDLNRNCVEQNDKYFYLKLDNGQVLFFQKDKLNEKAIESFNAIVRD